MKLSVRPTKNQSWKGQRTLELCRKLLAHRVLVCMVFLVLAISGAIGTYLVPVNYNMTDYLPQGAPSTVSLNTMEDAFGAGVPNARLYAQGVGIARAEELASELATVEGIDDVMWLGSVVDVKSPLELQDKELVSDWMTDDGFLYQLTIQDGEELGTLKEARKVVESFGANANFEGNAVTTADAQQSCEREVRLILIMAVIIIFIILSITSHSWFEPVVFLSVIGCAILMNMGTNLVLGSISFVSQICGAILQLAVSLDYAIVLLHTYQRCHREIADPVDAMAHAMVKGFSVVLSSTAVTFFGFLSLTVMDFGIGVDMGIVLAKGIVFSFLAVMFLMPCLTLVSLPLLDRTEHRFLLPPFDKFAVLCQKAMVPFAIIVILVAVPCMLGEGRTNFLYGMEGFLSEGTPAYAEKEVVQGEFGNTETWVVMVPEGDVVQERALADELKALPYVDGVTSYVTVAGQAMPLEVVPKSQLNQVVSNGWSRLVVTLGISGQSDYNFAAVSQVRNIASSHYGENAHVAGNLVSALDLRDTCKADAVRVQVFSLLSVGIVLAILFRSLSIPVLILIAIKMAIWINLAIPYFSGAYLNNIGYLVIDAVQLGAAVDYAIIFAREYFDRRKTYLPKEAARSAVKHSALTILTSSSILVCAGVAVFFISTNGVISSLGTLIWRGAFLSMLLMFMFLPWLFTTCDWIVRHTTYRCGFYVPQQARSSAARSDTSMQTRRSNRQRGLPAFVPNVFSKKGPSS